MAKREKKQVLPTEETSKEGFSIREDFSIEEAFSQMEEIIKNLQREDITLEESFRFYEEGMRLLQAANKDLDRVEKKVQVLQSSGDLADFLQDSDTERDSGMGEEGETDREELL